jgi:hypothetical protein
MELLIQAVKTTAREYYNTSYGWSMIEECWTDKEISEELTKHNIKDPYEAIAHFSVMADLHTEKYNEAKAEIF